MDGYFVGEFTINTNKDVPVNRGGVFADKNAGKDALPAWPNSIEKCE